MLAVVARARTVHPLGADVLAEPAAEHEYHL